MKEQVCEFGPQSKLVGILAQPAKKDALKDAPAIVMLNAGLLHRVGPHRMSVDLARRLVARGITSLRFDIGGCGDSESVAGSESSEIRALDEIEIALDFLESDLGIHKFVLLGLCSGADNSHLIALRDTRVVGAVFLDGHGYWTKWSYVKHYFPRLLTSQVWLNRVRRLNPRWQKSTQERSAIFQDRRRPFEPKPVVELEIQALVDRGAELLYCYSGGVGSYYNYAGQFFHMFRGLNPRGKIQVEYYSNVDHTYTYSEDRERMFKRVIDWYSSRKW